MRASSYGLVTATVAMIVSGCTSWVLAEDAAAPPAPTAMVRFVASHRFPAMFFKVDGQDQETKSVDDHGTPYGRFHADVLYNRPYKVRFEPSDDPYSFAKSGDRMIRIQTVGSNGKEGKLPAPEPAIILAMPVPSTPFYLRNPIGTPGAPLDEVHNMADLDNCAGSPLRPAFYLDPGEKLLYVRFFHAVDLILEDRTIQPTVFVTEPKDGATVSEIITVEADITEGVGVQTMGLRVDGYDKDYTKDLVNPRPYRISLDTTKLPDGPHELVAEAFRSSGVNVLSEKITVIVKNTSAPAASIEQPASKAVAAPGGEGVAAEAAKQAGAVSTNAAGKEQDAGGAPAKVFWMVFYSWREFDAYYRLEGQEQETKMLMGRGAYGTGGANLQCDRVYQIRFEPSDYSSFTAGDRMLKIGTWTSGGLGGSPMLMALPVPPTPFYFRDQYAPPGAHWPQAQSMAEFKAATSNVWYLKPAEKGAAGPYSSCNLYVKFYDYCMMILEDSALKPACSIVEPKGGETASGIIISRARITEKMGVMGVEFRVDGAATGYDKLEYGVNYHLPPARMLVDTRMLTDGPHEIVATALFSSGVRAPSEKLTFNVNNSLAGAPAKQPANK